MMLTKTSTPLYVQVKEEIIRSIQRGELAPGNQLPSQRQLVAAYGASHMTVRRALDELIGEGVIYAIPGKGIYVRDHKQEAESCPLVSFTEEMSLRGMRASSKVLAARMVPASTVMARTLDVDVGMPLVYLRRLRLADGLPMALQTNYLKSWLCPGLLDHDLENASLYHLLQEEFALCLATSKGSIEAVLADEEHASLLGLELPAALLVTEQVSFLEDGQPLEYTRTAYRGDRYQYRI
jgi:GntR family transcriptional regulator